MCHTLAGSKMETVYSRVFPGVAKKRVFSVCGKQKKLAISLLLDHADFGGTCKRTLPWPHGKR